MRWLGGPLGMNVFAKKDLSVGMFVPVILKFESDQEEKSKNSPPPPVGTHSTDGS